MEQRRIYQVGIIILLLLVVGCEDLNTGNCSELQIKYDNLINFNSYYIKGYQKYTEAYIERANALSSYELFSSYYVEEDYDTASFMCQDARETFSISNIYYNNAISLFNYSIEYSDFDKPKKLANYYIKISKQAIKINWALYEACEYFEVLDVENGNEKIVEHDSYVDEYNQLISDKDILEEMGDFFE
jgi:hypothetical protein